MIASGFIHSDIAWLAAGLAAIPLIIHLLSRRRYRREKWAAMELLLRAHQRTRRRMSFENWLLLATRTLVLGLLGFVIARPHLESSPLVAAAGESARDRVLILDDTLSMKATREDGRTAFDAARAAALQMVEALEFGDRVMVVRVSDARPTGGDWLTGRNSIRRVIDSLDCTDEPEQIQRALTTAAGLEAGGARAIAVRTAHVFTDLTAVSMQDASRPGADAGTNPARDGSSAAPDLSNLERIEFVDTGPKVRHNVAITALTCNGPLIGADTPARCRLAVTNHGQTKASDVPVEIRLDGKAARNILVKNIEPRATVETEFTVVPGRPGVHRLEAILSGRAGDVQAADDTRYLSLLVEDAIPVLLVEGRTELEKTAQSLFYYAVALAAVRSGENAFFQPTRIAHHDLANQVLRNFRVVVLGDVRQLAESSWRKLNQFLRDGGGILFFAGPNASADSYNKLAMGSPGFPLRLTRIVEPASPAGPLTLADPMHAIVRDFVGHDRGGLHDARLRGFWQVEPSAGLFPLRPVLSLESGEPVLLAGSADNGRFIAWLAGADMNWSNLPARPDFVPLAINMTMHAAGDAASGRNVEVGNAVVISSAGMSEDRLAFVEGPDLRRASGSIEVSSDGTVEFKGTSRPGFYTVMSTQGGPAFSESGQSRTVSLPDVQAPMPAEHRLHDFCVNVDPRESDLRRVEPSALTRSIGPQAAIVDEARGARPAAATPPRAEFAHLLAVFVFILAVLESFMATGFGHRR